MSGKIDDDASSAVFLASSALSEKDTAAAWSDDSSWGNGEIDGHLRVAAARGLLWSLFRQQNSK